MLSTSTRERHDLHKDFFESVVGGVASIERVDFVTDDWCSDHRLPEFQPAESLAVSEFGAVVNRSFFPRQTGAVGSLGRTY
jgi:hypothetical protein